MAAIKTVILDALNDLLEDEFKTFRWHLSNDSSIPRAKLEKVHQRDVVDLLVQHFGSAEAGTKAVQVLRKMNQNDCADCLERKIQEAVSGDVTAPSTALSSTGVIAPPAPVSGVSVNISSSSGGQVKAPVIHSAVIHGSVTFN